MDSNPPVLLLLFGVSIFVTMDVKNRGKKSGVERKKIHDQF